MHRSSCRYRQLQARKVNVERARLTVKAVAIHTASRGAAGTRTISGQLKQQGEVVGRYKAAKLMEETNIVSKQPSHKYKKATEESTIADNHLAREFNVMQANKVWCGDVTYIWSGKQWLYLAVVLDLYKRKLIGWACSTSPDLQLTIRALRIAYESRGHLKNVMFHSDQGWHYTSKIFRQQLWRY